MANVDYDKHNRTGGNCNIKEPVFCRTNVKGLPAWFV